MGTKTVSLSDDAYERLRRLKKENESFSDVVRRITAKVSLRDFHGALGEETAEEIEDTIKENRKIHRKNHEKKAEKIKKDLQQ